MVLKRELRGFENIERGDSVVVNGVLCLVFSVDHSLNCGGKPSIRVKQADRFSDLETPLINCGCNWKYSKIYNHRQPVFDNYMVAIFEQKRFLLEQKHRAMAELADMARSINFLCNTECEL